MSTSDTQHLNLGDQASSVVANQEPPRPLRRSRRIAQAREHAASLQWKATTDDMHCFERRKTNKGTCERDDRTAKKKTSQGVVSPMLALRDSPLGRLPIDVLLYFLEALDGPSLAQMESTCRQLNLFISRYQRTLYRGLFHSFAYQYELEGIDMRVHAPLWLGKSKQLLQQRMTTNGGTGNWSEDKVCDWKIQFAETYVYYVGMRCSVCLCNLEVGMSYYAWEVDMCKYCAVRNLINKGSLRAFGLTEADVVNAESWATSLFTIGIETKCIFYYRKHLEIIARQKQLAGVKPRRIKRIASGGLIDDVERRKRKAAEAAAAEQLRRKEVDTVLKKKGLRVTDLDSIWFPKALKHEFEEYITGKTDPALKRQRTRQRRQLTLATDTSTAIPTAISTTPASDRQPISLDKTKKNLKRTISTLADDAEEYIPKKKRYAAITRAIKKAGYDFERDVKTTFDGHLALWKVKDYLALDDSPSRTDAYIAKLEDTTSVSREVIRILDYERGFRDTMLKTFQSKEARELECVRRHSDFEKFYRKAREWWQSKARNIDVHRAGHAFVRYLVVRTEDHFEDAGTKRRRERLETYLQGTIDWYFTDLRDSIEKIRVKHFKVCERTYWRDHGDQFYTCELHTDLTAMARVFDDHVRGYSRQDSTNAVGMRILRHQRIVTKTRALRRRIFDATDELRSATPQTQTLKSPKASVAFDTALYSDSPRYQNLAVTFIQRAETFHRKLLRDCPNFTIERATRLAVEEYNYYVGDVGRILTPSRCVPLTSSTSSASGEDPADQFINVIRLQEKELVDRICQVEKLAAQNGLKPKYFARSKVNRVSTVSGRFSEDSLVGSSFQQIANTWIYASFLSGNVEKLLPALHKEVERQTREQRQAEVRDRIIKEATPFYEPEDWRLRMESRDADLMIFTRLSRKYNQYVTELAADVTEDDAVGDVIGLLKDLKSGKITKSAAVIADESDLW